jgi:carbon-monoxide dehydrogenase small subunit
MNCLRYPFRKHLALQYGFCTSDCCALLGLLGDKPSADEERMRDVLSGNLCRCRGYLPIVEVALEAREHRAKKQGTNAG